jgi:hypothetical protein
MTRIYHRYEKWECHINGMYKPFKGDIEEATEKCVDLLRSEEGLLDAMRHTAMEWKNSAEHNLSKDGKKYRSWLGQSACCFKVGAPEDITRTAWGMLTAEEKLTANLIADRIKGEWDVRENVCR